MANSGQPFEVNLLQTLDVDKVRKDIYPFGDATAPHNKNTGIERNGGVQNVYKKETVYPSAGYHYLTEDGRVLSAEDIPASDYKLIKVDGQAVGQVSKYGVESRAIIEGYDDCALTADGDVIAIRISLTTVTIYRLSLSGTVISSRTVTFSDLAGLTSYFSSLSLIRYQPMHYVDSQEFALRMGDNVVILKESTPNQIVSIGLGGDQATLFPGGGSLYRIGKYKNFVIFGSQNGKITSFDGINFKYSDGSGIGTGPFNNQTVVGSGTQPFDAIVEYTPDADTNWLVVLSANGNCRIGSWDGIAWKNYDGSGTGRGPFNNNGVVGATNGQSMATYLNYLVVTGSSGRVGSWHPTTGWKNYDGTGTGAGPFDNGTAIGSTALVVRTGVQFGSSFVIGAQSGRIACWNGTSWLLYNSGQPLTNNATVLGSNEVSILRVYGSQLVVATSGAVRVGSWDGTAWKNYDGTGTGTGIFANGVILSGTGVSTILPLLATLVFWSQNGTYASWDGTAWKNYDGTGTGTGIFGATTIPSPGGQGMVSITFGSRSIIVFQTNTGSYNYVDAQNRFGFVYTSSGTATGLQSRILLGTDLAGYLYAYKYESGTDYLFLITGNTSNRATSISTSAAPGTGVAFRGRYAMPQVSGNRTRHIVIADPSIVSSAVQTLYLQGYTNFSAYSATSVNQPNDTANVNAININGIGPAVGFNYSDSTYRTSASATDILELYYPNPTPTPIVFNAIRQSNTPTVVNGYGKLNNMVGVAITKPFEFRSVFVNGQQAAISIAMIDGGATDCLGVLLTNLGEWDDSHTPMIVDDDKILYRFGNRFFVVKIGTNIPDYFDKITSDLYKLNTIHPSNLYSDRDRVLYQSSMDYHGQAFFLSTTAPSSTATLVANVIANAYANSIDVGDKLVLISSFTSDNIEVFGARLPSNYGVTPPYAVDCYVNDEYAFSTLSDGTEIVDAQKDGLLYLPDTRVPVAIGADYQGSVAIIGGVTIILVPDYDGYLIGNDLQGAFAAFNLFGQTYLFDGNFVYLADIQSNVLNSATKVAPADGLTFIADSPTEIYFLSEFDNSLYTFTGGRALTKSKRFTGTTQILKGTYSVRDNTLLLETTDSFLFIRDSIISQIFKDIDQTALRLFYTVDGLVISNDVQNWQYSYEEIAGSTPYPLTLKTAYFGANSNIWAIVRDIVIVIYDAQRRRKSITITYDGYDDIRQYVESKKIVVEPTMYTQNGFARVRMQPASQRVLGASVQYDCDDFALVQEIDIFYESGQQQTIAPNRSV